MQIYEKVIKKEWNEDLEREGIITDRQFRFKTGSPYVTNLLSFYSCVIDITQGDGRANCIYLDFKKAFDRVLHRRLLWK